MDIQSDHSRDPDDLSPDTTEITLYSLKFSRLCLRFETKCSKNCLKIPLTKLHWAELTSTGTNLFEHALEKARFSSSPLLIERDILNVSSLHKNSTTLEPSKVSL